MFAVLLSLVALQTAPAWATDFTWSGAQAPFDTRWSTPFNWAGGIAPSGAAGTLTFPATACSSAACDASDDVPGLVASELAIVNPVGSGGMPPPGGWDIHGGDALTLSSGLSSSLQSTGSVSVAPAVLRLPITLGGTNTWTLGPQTHTAITGDVSGASQPLAVGVSGGADLVLSGGDAEVGAVTVTGADPSLMGGNALQNGSAVVVADASLNATDGRSVTVAHAGLTGVRGGVGSLSTTGAYLQVGSSQAPAAGSLAVHGSLTLDTGSDTTFSIIDNTGTAAGTDYSQLTATGPVALGGAGLKILVGTSGACPLLADGLVYTLVATSDAVSGTFGGLPDGATIPALGLGGCQSRATLRINYTAHTVTASVVSGGSGAGQPTATIRSPASGTTYNEGQTVAADYSCSAGGNGGVLQSCAGPVPNGTPIDTATTGRHTFTVTATDTDGQTASTTSAYTVIGPPTVMITAPADGASYNRGQVIRAEYSCQDAAGAPGIESCTGTVAAGSAIDTSTSGRHTFTVTVTSLDGQTAIATSNYTVPATAPADYTWTGASTLGTEWSDAANWAGGTAPGGSVLTLAFPPCDPAPGTLTCHAADDVAGVTATRLSIAGRFDATPGGSWDLAGPATLTLTSGLSTSFENDVTDGQYGADARLGMPITLGGANTWDLAQDTRLTGELSGSSQPLTVQFQPQFADNILSLEAAANEVGPVTIAGAAGCCFVGGWDRVSLGRPGSAGDLNAVDGHSVTVDAGASITGNGRVGPLAVESGGALQPVGELGVQGALRVASGATLEVPLRNGRITSTGPASLDGAYLAVELGCNLARTVPAGTAFTLVNAAGGLSGRLRTEAGQPIPDGGIIEVPSGPEPCLSLAITYTAHTVTATVVGPPTVTTGAAYQTDAGESLSGSVNPNGTPVNDCHFEWGTTTAYGSTAPCGQTVGTGTATVSVSAQIDNLGLTNGTLYHFRLVATGVRGTATGADATFTAGVPPPEPCPLGPGDTPNICSVNPDNGPVLGGTQILAYGSGLQPQDKLCFYVAPTVHAPAACISDAQVSFRDDRFFDASTPNLGNSAAVGIYYLGIERCCSYDPSANTYVTSDYVSNTTYLYFPPPPLVEPSDCDIFSIGAPGVLAGGARRRPQRALPSRAAARLHPVVAGRKNRRRVSKRDGHVDLLRRFMGGSLGLLRHQQVSPADHGGPRERIRRLADRRPGLENVGGRRRVRQRVHRERHRRGRIGSHGGAHRSGARTDVGRGVVGRGERLIRGRLLAV